MNIFVQHRLKYGEHDVGSETHQEEIHVDSENKHGTDRLIKMSLVEMKTSWIVWYNYYQFCRRILPSFLLHVTIMQIFNFFFPNFMKMSSGQKFQYFHQRRKREVQYSIFLLNLFIFILISFILSVLLYIELTISFLIDWKCTVNFSKSAPVMSYR